MRIGGLEKVKKTRGTTCSMCQCKRTVYWLTTGRWCEPCLLVYLSIKLGTIDQLMPHQILDGRPRRLKEHRN